MAASMNSVVTRGFGNGTFTGEIGLVVTMGYGVVTVNANAYRVSDLIGSSARHNLTGSSTRQDVMGSASRFTLKGSPARAGTLEGSEARSV